MDQVLDTTINFEPYVYPIQFSNYKNESALIKSFIENFYNLFQLVRVEILTMQIVKFYFINRLI